MINVATTSNVKKSEELMFRTKISNLDLMKKAGVACSNSFKFFGKVGILAGTGNNAGDGFVLAYELYKKNIDVTIILLKEKFSENGKHYFDICKENNIKILKYDFDMDLSKLEAERTALKTEYDSVKKVVSDNIERTFGIFS